MRCELAQNIHLESQMNSFDVGGQRRNVKANLSPSSVPVNTTTHDHFERNF